MKRRVMGNTGISTIVKYTNYDSYPEWASLYINDILIGDFTKGNLLIKYKIGDVISLHNNNSLHYSEPNLHIDGVNLGFASLGNPIYFTTTGKHEIEVRHHCPTC